MFWIIVGLWEEPTFELPMDAVWTQLNLERVLGGISGKESF